MGTLSSVSKFSWGQNKTNLALPLRGGSGSFLHFRSYCCCKKKYLNRLVTPTQLEAFEVPHIVKKGIWNAEINNLYLSQVPSQFFILIFHAAVLLYKWFPKPSHLNKFALRVLFPSAPCDFCHNCHKWLRQVQTKPHIACSIRKSKENGS